MIENLTEIVDHEGHPYYMYALTREHLGVEQVSLCFENADDYTVIPYREFDTLEIDTRFNMMINASVYCNVHYINNLLKYISEHKEQIKETLGDFLTDSEIDAFLEQTGSSIDAHNIEKERGTAVLLADEVPCLADATARKRYFILNEENEYKEVGFNTVVAVFGADTIKKRCRELDFLNGIGINGRAAWMTGLGIQDIDRDRFNSGWCRGDEW